MFKRLKSFLRQSESKSSRAARLIAIESGGRARWTPRDYTALAREGYARNAIVYRAVRLIAESIGMLSFVLYEGAEERDTHPLLNLVTRPNPRQDGTSLLEAVASHLLLAGNAYIEAVGPGNEGLQVRELYALRPDRMRLVPGPNGWPQAYEYTVAGSTMRFDQSAALPPILHLTFFNPLDDHYGLSPLEAAAMAVDTHNAAACWNKALLDNAARPSGALVYDGGEALFSRRCNTSG
jgi:HK97 family phage portal protein